jgi:hypothetical protein
MNSTASTTLMKNTEAVFSGAIWFQEAYFLTALQNEIDTAHQNNTALCVVVLRLPDYTRKAAHHLFAYAEAEDGNSFFGLLSNGDYAICMPECGYTEGTHERVALTHSLRDFNICSGLAVLDQETSATELLDVAAHVCTCARVNQFASVGVL